VQQCSCVLQLEVDRIEGNVIVYGMVSRLGERRYSSYSFTASALDGGEWSASRPVRALAPEKGPLVSIVQEAWWAP
jgi:hypothetical protein